MALHYFIDGYNLLHTVHAWDRLPKAEKIQRLIAWLEEKGASGSARNRVVIVFDGYAVPLKPGRSTGPRVVFSEDNDADSVIKEQVDGLSNPRDAVVITNDRAIQKWVRGAGAAVLSCEDFWKRGRAQAPDIPSEKIDADSAQRITDDLRRLWKLK
jgi:predicted RNA-binding protein with PIN domain